MNNLQWRSESGRNHEIVTWERKGRPIPPPPVVKQAIVRDYAERWGVRHLIDACLTDGHTVLNVHDFFQQTWVLPASSVDVDVEAFAHRLFADHEDVTVVERDRLYPEARLEDQRALVWLDLDLGGTPRGFSVPRVLSRPAARHLLLVAGARLEGQFGLETWSSMAAHYDYDFEVVDDIARFTPRLARRSFSVLMPTLNRPQRLVRAVEAVLDQQGDFDLQLVVKNGGDSVAHRLPADDRIVLVERPDAGIADAMNQALARAEGDICHWANDDDLMAEGALEFVTTWLDDAEWGWGRMRMVNEAGAEIAVTGVAPWDWKANLRANGVSQATCYWRRSLGAQVGEFDPAIGPCCDFDYWQRLGVFSTPKVTERILATYTVHDDSFTVRAADALADSAAAVRRKHGFES